MKHRTGELGESKLSGQSGGNGEIGGLGGEMGGGEDELKSLVWKASLLSLIGWKTGG